MRMAKPRLVQIYLDADLKREFKKACWLNDTTMSQQLRRMIRRYVNESKQTQQESGNH